MKFEEIIDEWTKDSEVDMSQIDIEIYNIPFLQGKYQKWMAKERVLLRKLKEDFETLKYEKTDFYIDGPTKEQIDAGWKYPINKAKILKADLPLIMAADSHIQEMNLRIASQQEKVEFLMMVMNHLNWRGSNLRTALDWIKFTSGPS